MNQLASTIRSLNEGEIALEDADLSSVEKAAVQSASGLMARHEFDAAGDVAMLDSIEWIGVSACQPAGQ